MFKQIDREEALKSHPILAQFFAPFTVDSAPDPYTRNDVSLEVEHDPAEMGKQDFNNARFDAGLAWVHYPEGLGGLGASRTLQNVVDAEFAAADAPGHNAELNAIGLGMAAPTILAYGSDEQQKRWLRKLWTAEEIFPESGYSTMSWPCTADSARYTIGSVPSFTVSCAKPPPGNPMKSPGPIFCLVSPMTSVPVPDNT